MNINGKYMNFRNKRLTNNIIKMGDLINANKSSIFDWNYYLERYPELKQQGIINEELAYHHWINYGINEGKIGVPGNNNQITYENFDWVSYLSINIDLVEAKIITKDAAWKHWMESGKQEGRIITNEIFKQQYESMINYKKTLPISTRPISLKYYTDRGSIMDSSRIKSIKINTVDFVKEKIRFPPASFMLIVDFPNYGGGTMFFLNTILSHYKNKTDFVIARNFNGSVYFYLNDDYMINDSYDLNESLLFINYYKSNISKIFVNSIIGHSPEFLNAVFNMGKEITGITHDYSLIFNRPHFLYSEIENIRSFAPIDINRFNLVITQNETNLDIYKNYIHNPGTNLLVSPLPDLKDSGIKTTSANEKVVVGIIGYISDIKGQYIVKKLLELSEKQGLFDVVIFGHTNIFYDKQYEYNSIHELNHLLNIHKPNLWIETSIWPETYSYTLSLAMITQLPILYQKKNFPSVIENRLASYSKAYSFANIEKLDSYEIIGKSQNYFYNISPTIYYNEFWDDYFGGGYVKHKSDSYNVVFVSSKIYTSNVPFTYVEKRSIYTTEERYKQTIATIDSIRKYIPNSFIILFDNSSFPINEYNELNSRADVFINNQSDKTIYNYTNVKTVKLYGELAQTAYVAKYIKENLKHMQINNFFKISGRYLINDTFYYGQYDNEINIFKKNAAVTDREYYYTSFYKIGGRFLYEYFNVINNMYIESSSSPYDTYDWEVILPKKMQHRFTTVNNLGITQYISAWNQNDMI